MYLIVELLNLSKCSVSQLFLFYNCHIQALLAKLTLTSIKLKPWLYILIRIYHIIIVIISFHIKFTIKISYEILFQPHKRIEYLYT